MQRGGSFCRKGDGREGGREGGVERMRERKKGLIMAK
jgi:hypothetical protein